MDCKKRQPIFCVTVLVFLVSNILFSQSNVLNTFKSNQIDDVSDVDFIFNTPNIDGQLDVELEHLEIREFNYVWQFDNPVTDTALINYRLAYTPTHLYVYIETNVDSVSYHRRGYLWGDGYKILVGLPQVDSLTNEYYELAYSPAKDRRYWERQQVHSYNFSQIRKHLSASSVSSEKSMFGKSGFETLIAWKDITPYHPWFLNQIGYNIYFAKGIESTEHGYITNGYSLVEDEGIWDEEIPRRNYQLIAFKDPASGFEKVLVANPAKYNLQVGEALIVEVASIDKHISEENVTVLFSDVDSNVVASKTFVIQLDKKLHKEKLEINMGNLKSGPYNVVVYDSKDTLVDDAVIIQPTIDFQKIRKKIQMNQVNIKQGSINTLQFELNQLSSKLTELKKYETGENILEAWKVFQKKYALFVSGTDPYENLSGPYRRAFKSIYDDSYQPYTIKLPETYDPNKKYPLLVFLHGSGQDEQRLLDRPRSGGNFIEIAPLARDIFRAYAEDESQKDIIEAIDDVSTYFAVDTSKIIIGGFSMGGYGALRTFYEHPELYKGIAVCAGHPNLANEWLDGEHPNFLDEDYLSSFVDVPVFIYHGRKDPALDVGLIEKMSEKLIKAGALVTQRIVAEKAHEYPDDETNALYFEWLTRTAN